MIKAIQLWWFLHKNPSAKQIKVTHADVVSSGWHTGMNKFGVQRMFESSISCPLAMSVQRNFNDYGAFAGINYFVTEGARMKLHTKFTLKDVKSIIKTQKPVTLAYIKA